MRYRLSICIPTYNRAGTLRELIESVVSSGRDDVEIIVSDNQSTDETEEMIRGYQARFNYVSYNRNAENIGIDRNFLKVASLARGEYSMIVGSDDAFPDGGIEAILRLCDEDPDVIVFDRLECDRYLKPMRVRRYSRGNAPAKRFDIRTEDDIAGYLDYFRTIGGAFSFISSNVYKTSRWKAIDCPPVIIGHSYPHVGVLLTLLKQGASVIYSEQPMILGRLGNDSFSKLSALERILLDVDGFEQLADVIFEGTPKAAAALRRLVVREHTEWGMGGAFLSFLSYRVRMPSRDWDIMKLRFAELGPLGREFSAWDRLLPNWLLVSPIRETLKFARKAMGR